MNLKEKYAELFELSDYQKKRIKELESEIEEEKSKNFFAFLHKKLRCNDLEVIKELLEIKKPDEDMFTSFASDLIEHHQIENFDINTFKYWINEYGLKNYSHECIQDIMNEVLVVALSWKNVDLMKSFYTEEFMINPKVNSEEAARLIRMAVNKQDIACLDYILNDKNFPKINLEDHHPIIYDALFHKKIISYLIIEQGIKRTSKLEEIITNFKQDYAIEYEQLELDKIFALKEEYDNLNSQLPQKGNKVKIKV